MSDDVEKLISKFCQWGQKAKFPKESLNKMPKTLRKIFYNELVKRDSLAHIMVRDLTNSYKLSCTINSHEKWCKSTSNLLGVNWEVDGKEPLVVGIVFPYWRRGLRKIIRDENLYDIISAFFHFASQYVARSRIVDIIGAIALTYNYTCDFRGRKLSTETINIDYNSNESELNKFKGNFKNNKKNLNNRERELKVWINTLNSLDPFIHRILFNYIRALDLYHNYFLEEAITSLDKTVNVAEQFIRERLKISKDNQREVLIEELNLVKEGEELQRLYKLRCNFGAHPSLSKWWDFAEIYDDNVDKLFKIIKKLIYRLSNLENQNRVVDKKPSQWSKWFNQNAMLLWESVWFK